MDDCFFKTLKPSVGIININIHNNTINFKFFDELDQLKQIYNAFPLDNG
jgi:hypothetical protein